MGHHRAPKQFRRHPAVRIVMACLAAGAAVGATVAAEAAVILGPADSIAIDQPRVTFRLEDPNTLEQPGPNLFDQALLDTGANGLLMAMAGYAYSDPYNIETRPDGSTVYYEEIGVAGTELLEVFKPYNVYFAGSDGEAIPIPGARMFGSPAADLGGLAGIIGMPAMASRVVHMDLRPLANLDLMGVTFGTSRLPPTATSYTVALPMLPYQHTGQQEPGDPLPTFADLPMVGGVQHVGKGQVRSLDILLDTGAQLTILSAARLAEMGYVLDFNDPGTDYLDIDGDGLVTPDDVLEVGGLGGSTLMPFVMLDELRVPTMEGATLTLTNVEVGVLDVAGLDGVFGMNLLTSGWFDSVLGGTGEYGYYLDIDLDFTNPSLGMMQINVNPDAVPEPSALLAAALLGLGMLSRRAPRRRAHLWPIDV
jgi:hypothetical protein